MILVEKPDGESTGSGTWPTRAPHNGTLSTLRMSLEAEMFHYVKERRVCCGVIAARFQMVGMNKVYQKTALQSVLITFRNCLFFAIMFALTVGF